MSFNFLLQIETVPTPESGTSMWDIISKSNVGMGWIVNLLLLVIMAYAIYTFTERFIALRRSLNEDVDFLSKVNAFLMDGNIDAAKKYCSNSDNPAARILENGIERLGKPNEGIYNTLRNSSAREILTLRNRVYFLKFAAFSAPVLGFLATSITIIIVSSNFQTMQALDLKILTNDLSPAFFTVAFGCLVGALSAIFHFVLTNYIHKIELMLEETTLEFMNVLYGPSK
jgi:biopolymer transport protein ExbB